MTGFVKLTEAHDTELTLALSHGQESNVSTLNPSTLT